MCDLAKTFDIKAKATKVNDLELIKLVNKNNDFKVKKWKIRNRA